jgi:uncharacterized protein with beta-barrel porin domain
MQFQYLLRKAVACRLATAAAGRLAALAGLLALMLLVTGNQALAACQPDPIGGSATVNCTADGGTQTTQVGSGTEDGRTVNVQSGATIDVSGTGANGIWLQDGNTITNAGTIIVDNGAGILARDGNTITNIGSIIAGDNGAGIVVQNGNPLVINRGSIAVGNGGAGIDVCCDNTVINSGSITALESAVGIVAGDRVTITNSGTITVGDFSYGIFANGDGAIGPGTNATVTNNGTIIAGNGGFGINAFENYNVVNSGTIKVGDGGIGIQVDDSNTVFNSGSVLAPNGFSIVGGSDNNITNTGLLLGSILLLGSNNTLTNQGTIILGDPANYTAPAGALIAGTLENQLTGTIGVRVDPTSNDTYQADTINLNGRLHILVTRGLYERTTVYSTATTGIAPLIACGCGALTGQFSTVTSSSPFFTATADYSTPSEVNVILTRIDFGSVPGMTPNQRAVGNALEGSYSTTLTGNAAAFYSNLLAATSVTALDQLSGEGTSAAQNAAFSAGSLFNGAMQTQGLFAPDLGGLSVVIPPAQYAATRIAPGHEAFASLDKTAALAQQPGRFRIWTAGFGASQSLQGQADTGSASQSVRSAGGVLGFDWQAAPDLRVGLAVGGSESTFSVAGLATSGRMTAGHVGAYAMKTWGAYYVAASLSYARLDNSTTRTIIGIGPTETVSGRFDSDQLSARLEIGWKQAYGRVNVTPFVAVEPSVLWQRGYTESGTGILGLTVASHTATSLPTFVGVQFDGRYVMPDGAVLAPYSRLSWVHEFEPDRRVSAAFITVPGASFTVNGARAASDAARLDTGAKLMFSGGLALFANFTGEWSDHTHSYAGSGGFRYIW